MNYNMNLTKILLIFLFFSLPLIHGGIFSTLGIDFKLIVSGNFEFTKSLFFNITSSLILLSFFIDTSFEEQESPDMYGGKAFKISGIILLIIAFSTAFSLSPFTSLIGDDNKGHTALLFFNLLGIFFVLRSLDQAFLKQLIYISFFSGICASLIAIKELYSPTFNYGHLADRALGTFGHPNYLSGYLLLVLGFTGIIKDNIFRIILITTIGICILLTKSIVAIVITLGYLSYLGTIYFYQHSFISQQQKKSLALNGGKIIFTGGAFVLMALFMLIILYFPEKLHSFLSRFYIWETTLSIIFSDWRIFLFGGGAETLSYVFESFKSPEVYIYENFGFTADRPHNFFLNIFYHFGILGVGLLFFVLYRFYRSIKSGKNTTPKQKCIHLVILLFLLYGIIHFFSIASYLLIALGLSVLSRGKLQDTSGENIKNTSGIFLGILSLISITGAYYSLQFYRAEVLFAEKKTEQAQNIFSHPKYLLSLGDSYTAMEKEGLLSAQNLKSQISLGYEEQLCEKLVTKFPSPENYFYCGDIFGRAGNIELSHKYYNSGLDKLPDLWNQDSPYWDNYFIKNTITGNRFFSEKFGDIKSILEKLENYK